MRLTSEPCCTCGERVSQKEDVGELVRLDLEKGTSETVTSHGSRLFGSAAMDPTESLVITGDLEG